MDSTVNENKTKKVHTLVLLQECADRTIGLISLWFSALQWKQTIAFQPMLQAGWLVAFLCWKDSEFFSDVKISCLQFFLWVYYSARKAAVEAKLTSNAKCAADITYGGNAHVAQEAC